MMASDFYLGTHLPEWLHDKRFARVKLFVSRRRLCRIARPKPAVTDWALDSGGFTEISMFGKWKTPPSAYVDEVRRWSSEIGRMRWAAIQDWMCEPFMVKKTGLSIREHQERTVESLCDLRRLAPEIPWAPVLQGYSATQYIAHIYMYRNAGFDLTKEPIVGLGSVCRRQATDEIAMITRRLASRGIRLHGFGMKKQGIARSRKHLASSDSMAWSLAARRRPVRLPGCAHKNCGNCRLWALEWRADLLTVFRQEKRLT